MQHVRHAYDVPNIPLPDDEVEFIGSSILIIYFKLHSVYRYSVIFILYTTIYTSEESTAPHGRTTAPATGKVANKSSSILVQPASIVSLFQGCNTIIVSRFPIIRTTVPAADVVIKAYACGLVWLAPGQSCLGSVPRRPISVAWG